MLRVKRKSVPLGNQRQNVVSVVIGVVAFVVIDSLEVMGPPWSNLRIN